MSELVVVAWNLAEISTKQIDLWQGEQRKTNT